MSEWLLWAGAIGSVAHLVAAVWWARNGRDAFRGFGAVILGGSGAVLAYIVIRTLVERS